MYHVPVLLEESLELLDVRPDGTYVDLTFGGGGHSRAILSRIGPDGRLYAFDQDADALANAPDDDRFTLIHSNFRFMRGALRAAGVTTVDGILADLGVSSHHFDTPDRGFSFRFDAPLDMRMNRSSALTAQTILDTYSNAELTRILRDYGQIDTPFKAANCIERARPLHTIRELVDALAPCTPKADPNKFLSKLFQALRIEVNGEIEALVMALEQSLRVLRPGGRLVMISYHSLEDRLVKNFLRSGRVDGQTEKDFFGRTSTPFELLTRSPVTPAEPELSENPRSRSAKLRAAAKI